MSASDILDRLRKASTAIYIACDEAPAADISALLTEAADAITSAQGVIRSMHACIGEIHAIVNEAQALSASDPAVLERLRLMSDAIDDISAAIVARQVNR